MFSVKRINYSMCQSVKLVESQRKTTIVGLRTDSYIGAKLWNDNAVLCNELWNEDFRTFKHIVNESNLDIITYGDFQYSWKPTSAQLILIFSFIFSYFIVFSILHTGSYMSHWLMFLLWIRLEIKLILSYFILTSNLQYLFFYDWAMNDFMKHFRRHFIDFAIFILYYRMYLIYVYICTVYFACTRVLY